jgi:hypothetical protein
MNTLVQNNFEEISKLSKEDREVVLTYFGNWTESSPAYYADGETLGEKFESLFRNWLYHETDLTESEMVDLVDNSKDRIWEWASYNEYEIETILELYHGDCGNLLEEFQELCENNFVESES